MILQKSRSHHSALINEFPYLLARPFLYNTVTGEPFTAWLGAPLPEYPAAHASPSIANAEAMTVIFGDDYAFTDHTFEGLVTPQGIVLHPRSYSTFLSFIKTASLSDVKFQTIVSAFNVHSRPSFLISSCPIILEKTAPIR